MEVILLERVSKLGHMGEVVKVKDGFARNFLLRQGKALRATEANRAKFERERAALEARNAERRAAAGEEAKSLDGKTFTLIRQAGESGQLYGSVSPRDIVEAAAAVGVKIDRGHVMLANPIKTIGLHDVVVSPHPEVEVKVTVNVARSPEEAAAQARGEDLTGPTSDRAEIRAAAEALFEEAQAEAAREDNA
ncbi:MAG: 50S ribosomal protein L9 [Aestuariivirga sp.]|uniref:50S ribosomal protein L9 n=1 Tax=Aestuariivirga sp. TaxID=2650926 RepID=UPI0025B8F71F|nr:50S ribosomal protein L9 [Aestuariivirga sp.]MCA3561780.1 50S ribosomal protein L9 [Aestuariivirga sp.]